MLKEQQEQEQRQNQHLPVGVDVFLTCSAFEYGGDTQRSPDMGCITAFRYPLKCPRDYCSRPFERAVIRLTRESLSVYRPTERVLYCDLMWHDVRDMRRHISYTNEKEIYEFAFITQSGIVVLEVTDAVTADGISTSLQLLKIVGCAPILRAHTAKIGTTPSKANVASVPSAAIAQKRATANEPRSISSTRSFSPPPATTLQKVERGETKDNILQRIRRREEEMREAIFYMPPCRLHTAFPRSGVSEMTTRFSQQPNSSSSPAPRPQLPVARPLDHVDVEKVDGPSQPAPRPSPSGSDTTAGMHELLQLLEKEEKKASRSLRSQEERLRTLRIQEDARTSRVLQHSDTNVYSGVSRYNSMLERVGGTSSAIGRVNVTPTEESVHGNCTTETWKERKAQPPLQDEELVAQSTKEQGGECHWDVRHHTPECRNQLGKKNEEIAAEVDASAASGAASLFLPSDEKVVWKTNGTEAPLPVSQLKVGEEEQVSIRGVSLGDSQNCERLEETQNPQRGIVVPETIKQASDTVVSTAVTEATAAASPTSKPQQLPEAKGHMALYGYWKELRHKETGKMYYRHIKTKEAVWKPPPEVLEMKQQEQNKENKVTSKMGLLRVSGPWKEFRDAKSGRLYYANNETKHRTWNVEETPFAKEE